MNNKNNIFVLLFFLLSILSILKAQDLVMQKGDSRVFTTVSNITTVFTSNPKIIDYRIINNRQFVVFANDNGRGDLVVFGDKVNGQPLIQLKISVDQFAGKFEKLSKVIENEIKGSTITVSRLTHFGEPQNYGYSISGTVPNEESRDKAYNMAALALGLGPALERIEKKPINADGTTETASEGDRPENVEFLKKYDSPLLIDNLEIQLTNQVNVKLIVIDIEKSLREKLGLEFSPKALIASTIKGGFLDGIKNYGTAITNTIEAFKNEQMAKILAQPNISVLSGESAKFRVVGEYTPVSSTTNTATGNTTITPNAPREYGISLVIQPKVMSKDKITVRIAQEVSNIQSINEKGGSSYVNLKVRNAESTIQVADGQSFIIGGLLNEDNNENVDSTPFLGDIPYLGGLFRQSGIKRSKSELIIIATVNLAHPVSDDVYVSTRKNRSLLESFFNIPPEKRDTSSNEIREFLQNVGFSR